MGLDGAQYLMYHLLNNLAGCTICFPNSIMNIFIFVITLILSSIDKVFDSSPRYILFLL